MENIDITKYNFEEVFKVRFVVEAKTYSEAYKKYSDMFDKNISLGYDKWKNAEDIEFVGGRFHVDTKNGETLDTSFIDKEWSGIEEEE